MAKSTASAEPPRMPPPIPIRSPMRNGSAYQLKLRAAGSEAASTSTTKASATLFEEMDLGLTETHRRLVGAVFHGKTMHDQYISEDHDPNLVGNVNTLGRTAQQGSHDGTMTHTLRCADARSPSPRYDSENMEARVSAWLAKGLLSPTLQPVDSRGSANRDYSSLKPVPLSLFPPTSPLTGKREFAPSDCLVPRPVCPLSPLDNGRDVYGNYISSNKLDYLMAQSPPISYDIRKKASDQSSGISGSYSLMARLRGGGWNGLNPFCKMASTEKLQQETQITPTQSIFEHDKASQEISAVTESGRLDSRLPRNMRSLFYPVHSRKDPKTVGNSSSKPFAVDKSRQGDQFGRGNIGQRPEINHSASTDESSERRARIDTILNNHFGFHTPLMVPIPPSSQSNTRETVDSQKMQEVASTVSNPNTTPRDEKRWNKRNLSPPPQSPLSHPPRYLDPGPVAYNLSDHSDSSSHLAPSIMSTNTVDDPWINLPGLKPSIAYKKVECDREIRHIQEQRRLHEEADRLREDEFMRIEEVQKQEPDRSMIVPDDTVTVVVRRRKSQRHELPQMATVDEQYCTSTLTPAPRPSNYGAVPVNKHQPRKKWHHQHYTVGRSSTMPVPGAVTPNHVSKRHNSFRNVLAKAGKLTRLILTVSSDPDLKTYSQRNPPVDQIQKEKRRSSMSVDRYRWPSKHLPTAGPYGTTMSPPTTDLKIKPSLDRERPEMSQSSFPRSRKLKKDRPEQRDIKETGNGVTVVRDFGSKNYNEAIGRAFNMDLPGKPLTRSTQPNNLGFPRSRITAAKDLSSHSQVMNLFGTPTAFSGLTGHENAASTQPQSSGYPRRRLRAEPNVYIAGPSILSISNTASNQPDSNGALHVRHNDNEMQLINPTVGHPNHTQLKKSYDVQAERITEKWLNDIVANRDPNGDMLVGISGSSGSGSKDKDSTNSSQDAHRISFTSALNLAPVTTAATAPSPNLSLDEATYETIRGAGIDARSGTDVPPMRSRFSMDSEVKMRRVAKAKAKTEKGKKRERKGDNVWRNEDRARAMAMHSLT